MSTMIMIMTHELGSDFRCQPDTIVNEILLLS